MRAEAAGPRARARALVAVALLALGCEQPDYTGASFKPVEGPSQSAQLLLYVVRPPSDQVPWGDAALYHRRTPAGRGVAPALYQASLDGGRFTASDSEGGRRWALEAGPHSIGLAIDGARPRTWLHQARSDSLAVSIWALDEGDRALVVTERFPATDLIAGPLAEVSARIEGLRTFLRALAAGLEYDPEGLEAVLFEDFRDPLGGRGDLIRALRTEAARGQAARVVGDAFFELDGESVRLHMTVERGAVRTHPTFELEEDPNAPGGYRARTWL